MINKVIVGRFIPAAVLLATSMFVSGCSTISYYHQAIDGQLTILMHRQPITRVIADPATPPALQKKLSQVLRMRRFAVDVLDLPDNPSYTTYVDLKRPYVVWNVFAAPELSLTPMQWCFPFAGCLNYRGYFAENDARRFADKLARKGNDVYVAGISAYSTLGWFHDPLLNTMLTRSMTNLAGTLFHEMAHQQVFARDDTTFNESFATMVELEGVRRWLQHEGEVDRYQDYQVALRRKMQFIELVQGTRKKLNRLYQAERSDQSKREGKQRIFAELKQDYRGLRADWGGYRGYDGWFDRKLNNAQLVPIGSYYDYLPAFQVLLRQHNGNLRAFYESVARLAAQPPAKRHAAINRLMPAR